MLMWRIMQETVPVVYTYTSLISEVCDGMYVAIARPVILSVKLMQVKEQVPGVF